MPFIPDQNLIREDYKVKLKNSSVLIILKKNSSKGLIFLSIFAIVVPLLIYYFVIDQGSYTTTDQHTCSVNKTYRIPCGNPNLASIKHCNEINCCYDSENKTCFHYLPSKYQYHGSNNEPYHPSMPKTPFGNEQSPDLYLSVQEIDENKVNIILDKIPTQNLNITTKNYYINKTESPLVVDVCRNDNNLLFTTANGPLIVSENYWEWSFQLTEEYIFGLGQTLIDLDRNSTFTKVIYHNKLDHNSLPNFLAFKNKTYHGLIVRHDGPLEVTVLPSKLVILKGLVHKKLVLELSIGPSVKDVVLQQRGEQDFVKFWTLGVHICREGSSYNLKNILKEYSSINYSFSYVSDCIHQNLLMALRNQNTKPDEISQLLEAISGLKNNSKRFILSVPPHIPVESNLYTKTASLNIFYKKKSEDYVGKYLNNEVVYPWFGHESIDRFLQLELEDMLNLLGSHFPSDFLLNANWPSDESWKMDNNTKDFVYLPANLIDSMSTTLPWNVTTTTNIWQMGLHNDYGELHTKTFKQVLEKNNLPNTFLLTSSPNSDVSVVEEYDISWSNFQKAITKVLFNSVLGSVMTSVPVCGSTETFSSYQESLCMRWYSMASTSPVFRISSNQPRRDPDSLYTATATQEALKSIQFRHQLIYYFYTVLNYHKEPLMRPMFYDFPSDSKTFPLTDQYMVGKNLLLAHPTLPDKTKLMVYLPTSVDVWFEFWGGTAYDLNSRKNGTIELDIVETDRIVFLSHSSIVPLTFIEDDRISVLLKVALKLEEDGSWKADGSLLVGEDLFNFVSSDAKLTIARREFQASDEIDNRPFILSGIVIYRLDKTESTVCRNSLPAEDLRQINSTLEILYESVC